LFGAITGNPSGFPFFVRAIFCALAVAGEGVGFMQRLTKSAARALDSSLYSSGSAIAYFIGWQCVLTWPT